MAAPLIELVARDIAEQECRSQGRAFNEAWAQDCDRFISGAEAAVRTTLNRVQVLMRRLGMENERIQLAMALESDLDDDTIFPVR